MNTGKFRSLDWAHGHLELHRLGAMLAPVVFRAPGRSDFSPLHVAPWIGTPDADGLTGLLAGLRGEWPCVPFGRTDRPDALPAGWTARTPHDGFGHGHGSHHDWDWLPDPAGDGPALALGLTLPDTDPVQRLTRIVRARPDAAAVDIELHIEAREPCTWPVALHPTLRLDAGQVHLDIDHGGPGLTYPVPAEPGGRSRLAPDRTFTRLDAVPTVQGPPADLSRYPQPVDSEELLQLMQVERPVTAHYLDPGWSLTLDWDRALLPDVMLWVSHRGRGHAPWNGRNLALGVEPVHGVFDLGRVAAPPAGHPLAVRTGLRLVPGRPLVIRSSLSARPLPARTPAGAAP